MKELPILFSTPMILALLDGRKTQTRRIVKPQPDERGNWPRGSRPGIRVGDCPHGENGDLLWVREAWRTIDTADSLAPSSLNAAYRLWFEADKPHQPGYGRLRPSTHMPRWASRITLEVTQVRIERLQSISAADALAEGVNVHKDHHGKPNISIYSPVQAFRDLWESINGLDSWDANQWVWVIEFRRVS